MGPVFKNIAIEQHLISHGGIEFWHSRVQDMMVGSLDHRDAVYLDVPKVFNRTEGTGYAAPIGLGLQQTL